MNYQHEIVKALQMHGCLGLMDLRRKVCGLSGHEADMRVVKADTQRLAKAGIVNVDHVKNGFLFTLKDKK